MADVTIELRGMGEVNAFLKHVYASQIPFATAKGVRQSALDFQAAQRAHQRSIFNVTRPDWVDRAVKITKFPTKAVPEATLRIEPPGGQARADILTKFETETEKRPRFAEALWVPQPAVLGPNQRIVRGMRPKQLRLQTIARGKRGEVIQAGKKRTYAIFRGTFGAIFHAAPDGKGKGTVLYVRRRRVPIEPELDFIDNARKVVGANWAKNFTAAFAQAMRTAR